MLRAPHFLDKSTKTLESDDLNFKGCVTGCRRKVTRHADRLCGARELGNIFTTKQLRKNNA